MTPEAPGSGEYVGRLEQAVRDLADALQGHRADMHHPSDRPCATCGTSAKALRSVGVTPFVERSGMDREAACEAARQATVSDG